jgi:NitT/TauT family transport system ATP-binding protein
VQLIVLPPPLLVDALREGQIDGFCVGEPWNSLAVSVGVGCIVTTTSEIWRLSPEKVLGLRDEWAQRCPQQVSALVRAMYRAAMWCDEPGNHAELANLLSQPKYIGAPAELLMRGLSGKLTLVQGGESHEIPNFYVPHRQVATFPWTSHALWFYSQMARWRQLEFSTTHVTAVRNTYRPDLYRAALAPMGVAVPVADMKVEGAAAEARALRSSTGAFNYGPDGFFDHRIFDPDQLAEYAKHTM